MAIDLKINETPLRIGAPVEDLDLEGAAFRKTGLWKRLLRKLPSDVQCFEAENCTLSCFDDALQIYPCTHGYLTPDRQWRTRATLLIRGNRIRKVLFRIVEGHYSAVNFLERFQELCIEHLGQPLESDRSYAQWRRDDVLVTQVLHPDRKNADISIKLHDEA